MRRLLLKLQSILFGPEPPPRWAYHYVAITNEQAEIIDAVWNVRAHDKRVGVIVRKMNSHT